MNMWKLQRDQTSRAKVLEYKSSQSRCTSDRQKNPVWGIRPLARSYAVRLSRLQNPEEQVIKICRAAFREEVSCEQESSCWKQWLLPKTCGETRFRGEPPVHPSGACQLFGGTEIFSWCIFLLLGEKKSNSLSDSQCRQFTVTHR